VGNPANTNALIAMKNAPDLDPRNFKRDDASRHNRAIAQVALKLFSRSATSRRMIIWGNHSGTQYPDLDHAEFAAVWCANCYRIRTGWNANLSPPCKSAARRSSEARGLSSAASAANARSLACP